MSSSLLGKLAPPCLYIGSNCSGAVREFIALHQILEDLLFFMEVVGGQTSIITLVMHQQDKLHNMQCALLTLHTAYVTSALLAG